jgi:ParB family chromosome partitioning protein
MAKKAKAKSKGTKKSTKGNKSKGNKKSTKKGKGSGPATNEPKLQFISPNKAGKLIDENISVRDVDRRDPKFKELVESVKRHGIILPIVFAKDAKGELRLVDGRQRIDAARQAKNKSIPYIITPGTYEELISKGLDANEARVPMSVIQEAMVLKRATKLLKKKKGKVPSAVALGKFLGRNPRWIEDRVNLLGMPKEIQDALDDNSGWATIGKCHELARVHPKDRGQLIPMMKRMSVKPFRAHIEKKAKAGEIKWAKGQSKPRTEAGKKGTSDKKKGTSDYSKTIKAGKGGPSAEIDVLKPTAIEKALTQAERALNSENKKKKPSSVEVAYQRGFIHALLLTLNLPQADSMKDSLAKFEAAAKKNATKKNGKKKKVVKKK